MHLWWVTNLWWEGLLAKGLSARFNLALTLKLEISQLSKLYEYLSSYSNVQEKADIKNPQLAHEAKLLRQLVQNGHHLKGFPQVLWSGQEGTREKGVYIMVMDILGPSLEDLYKFCGGRFSLKTTLMVGHQMVINLYFTLSLHSLVNPYEYI